MGYLENYEIDDIENALSSMIKTAYGFSKDMTDIERVYNKKNKPCCFIIYWNNICCNVYFDISK